MEQQSLQNAYKHQSIGEQVSLQREEVENQISFCPNCAGVISPNMRFCEECGYSLLAKECPHCHKPVSAGMALCPHCMHPVNATRCSFCGEVKEADDLFCTNCGNPSQGIECPQCKTLNFRSFCRVCNTPLNEMAHQAVEEAKNDPRMQKVWQLAQELVDMQDSILSVPETTEADEVSVDVLSDEDKQLLNKYRNLFSHLEKAPISDDDKSIHRESKSPNVKKETSKQHKSVPSLADLQKKIEEMKAAMASIFPDPNATPEVQRNFICARKIQISEKVKSCWICNYCGCRHNQPSECAREELGGEWEYRIKITEAEILT